MLFGVDARVCGNDVRWGVLNSAVTGIEPAIFNCKSNALATAPPNHNTRGIIQIHSHDVRCGRAPGEREERREALSSMKMTKMT